MNISERLTDVFRTVFDDANLEINDSTTANEVEGWDSIAHISLIFAVEEEFGIKFSTADLEGMRSVGDLRHAIGKRLALV